MKYMIDPKIKPAYLQIYHQIRDDIIAELYPYHSKLPSKRSLAAELGVSTITIEHAYSLLYEEGYIETKERVGYIVIFRNTDGFASPMNTLFDRPFSNRLPNDYPEFPISVLSKTMRKVLTEDRDLLFEKSPNPGCDNLRIAIRQYLARNRGIQVDIDQIIIGSGSEYLYTLIVELFGRQHVYAIESPSYKKIQQVYESAEVTFESLPLVDTGIDSNALESTNADILHTSPFRSYPSGVTATASKRHEYIRWAAQKDRYIIEDDFESEFSVSTKPAETLFSLSPENVIYLNTFSQTISPSLRIAYMVLPKSLTELFEKKLGFYSCTVPTCMQYVLAELINNGDFERHINRVRRQLRKKLLTAESDFPHTK